MITEIILTVNNIYTVSAIPCEVIVSKNKDINDEEIFSNISHLSAISRRSIIKSRFLKFRTNKNDDYVVFNNYGYGFVIYKKDLDYIDGINQDDITDIMFKAKHKLVSIMINLDNKNYGDSNE